MSTLLKRQKEFNIATQIIGAALIFLDDNLVVQYYTPILKKFFKTKKNLDGTHIANFTELHDYNLTSICKEVLTSMTPHSSEIQNEYGIWFRMQIHLNVSLENEEIGIIISFTNIHELKIRLEESIKFNEFYNHVANTNPAAIMIYNLIDKEFSYVSNNLLKLAGYNNLQEIERKRGNLWEAIIYKEDIKKVKNYYNTVSKLNISTTSQIEYRVTHKITGEKIWLLSTSKVYKKNSIGQPISIITSIQNINQTINLKSELELFSSRVEAAFKSSNSAIWEWDNTKKNKVWWSEQLYELTGWSEDTIKGDVQKVFELIHTDDIRSFKENMSLLLSKGIHLEEDIRLKTTQKGYLWFRVNGKKQNCGAKIVGTLTCINQRKEAENELKKLNQELERFAYLASHDLKEPLQTITSFIGLIKEESFKKLDSDGKLYLQFIDDATHRMISLINDLLIYSQLGNKSLQMDYYDTNEIVKNTLMDLKQLTKSSKAEITIHNLPVIFCDKVQIRQLFQNLISNSLKYRKNDTTPLIMIGCSEQNDDYLFFVKDNGIGIEPKHFNKIFEVFKRLHTTNEYEGNGIGLANCRRIVTNHQGRIWLDSVPMGGTTIFFTIPTNLI